MVDRKANASGWLLLAAACCGWWSLLVSNTALGNQHVAVVFDDSGSMANAMQTADGQRPKIDVARRALLQAVQQLSDEATMGVLALNSQGANGRWIVPLDRIDHGRVEAAILGMRASGGTPLGAAMKVAADALLKQRAASRFGSFRLLIVSDGEAHDGELVERYLREIKRRGLMVDVIGVAMDQQHSLASQVDRYRAANDEAALIEALQQSLAETPAPVDGASDQLEYHLLEGLPDETARAAVDALSTFDATPIGQSASATDRFDEVPARLEVDPTIRPESDRAVGVGTRTAIGMTFVVLLASLVVLMIFSKRLIRMDRRGR